MLLEISIKNFAIIEEISLQFDNGMTVLTGETGAGKSIIIDAMNMMLGARASTEVIRHGAQKAEIEGFFSLGKIKHSKKFYRKMDWNFLMIWLSEEKFLLMGEVSVALMVKWSIWQHLNKSVSF